jgi:DNA (cytosine-5)-methyltransferase 1
VWEGDVRLFNPSEYKGRVDIIHAGFPCQDISTAGNQAGIGKGTRSGLYREVLRIADEIQPEYIFLENVAAICTIDDGAALRTVVADLAEMGFDSQWVCLSAAQVGAAHKRDRWWLLGHPKHSGLDAAEIGRGANEGDDGYSTRQEQASEPSGPSEQHEDVDYTDSTYSEGGGISIRVHQEHTISKRRGSNGDACKDVADTKCIGQQRSRQYVNPGDQTQNREWQTSDAVHECVRSEWQAKSSMGGVANDVPDNMVRWNDVEAEVGRVTDESQNRADKLKALGNAQVPLQAATAFSILWKMMEAANERT